jgi:glutaredoxin
MRVVLILALLTASGLGGMWILAQRDPDVARPSGASVESAEREPGTTSGLAKAQQLLDRFIPSPPAAVPVASTDAATFYQWVDQTGSVHFAQRLEDVPPQWRDRVGRIEVANRATPTPPAQRDARRPYAAVASQPEVVVYSTSWCGWCRRTIAWLDENRIAYVNKDIERDDRWRAELIEKTGRTTIPVVEIGGQLVQGFDPERMDELL